MDAITHVFLQAEYGYGEKIEPFSVDNDDF